MARKATTYADVLVGEADYENGDEARYEDMKAIASVIENRSAALGVPAEDVYSRQSEFNAYGTVMPSGSDIPKYQAMAERAIAEVRANGPTTRATFYSTPKTTGNLPKGLRQIGRTTGHVYFTDPQERAINIRGGTRRFDYGRLARSIAAIEADERLREGWGRGGGMPTLDNAPAARGIPVPTPRPDPAYRRVRDDGLPTRGISSAIPGGLLAPSVTQRMEGFAPTIDDGTVRRGIPVPTQAPRGTAPPPGRQGSLNYAPAPARTGAARAIGGLLGEARAPGLAGIVSNLPATGRTALSAYDREHLSPSLGGVMDALDAAGFGDAGINSGYRDPARNARANGARKSQHLHGNALDIDVRGWSEAQKTALLDTAIGAGARGVGIYGSGNIIHVDTRKSPALWGMDGTFKGQTVDKAPAWARPSLEAMFAGTSVSPRAAPASVPVPTPAPRGLPAGPTAPAGFPGPAPAVASPRAHTQSFDVPTVTPASRPGIPSPGVPTPAFAGLPAGVDARMAGFPDAPASRAKAAPSGGLLGGIDDAIGAVGRGIGGLLGVSPANAASANADPLQAIGPPGGMTPNTRAGIAGRFEDMDAYRNTYPSLDPGRGPRVARAAPPSPAPAPAPATPQRVPGFPTPSMPGIGKPPASPPVSRVGANSPLADIGQPGMAPSPVPAAPAAPALARDPHDGIAMGAFAPASPSLPALPAPRDIGPAPIVAGPVGRPQVSAVDPWGGMRSATVPSVSPNVPAPRGLLSPMQPQDVMSSNLAGPVAGAMLGGLLAGPVGAAAGGLLGSPAVRDAIGLGGLLGGTAPRGDGITTGTITGKAIPQEVMRPGGSGYSGLGLPSIPDKPKQLTKAERDRLDRESRGGNGPSISKSARDSISRSGAGVGGLF